MESEEGVKAIERDILRFIEENPGCNVVEIGNAMLPNGKCGPVLIRKTVESLARMGKIKGQAYTFVGYLSASASVRT